MASVTVNLTGYQNASFQGSFSVRWVDDISLGATFDDAGTPQILEEASIYYSGARAGQVNIFF